MLARAPKSQNSKSLVSALTTSSGSKIHSTPELAEAFRKFYLNSYNLRPTPSALQQTSLLSEMTTYLQEAQLPRLTQEERESLSQLLSSEEFAMAIAATQPEKAPGMDSFTLSYYRTFQTTLTPHFLEAFNAITDGHSTRSKLLSANISVIPKPGKDPLQCASYRPISLLNCDIKLFTKIIATRLNVILQRIVSLDQVGFIQSKEVRDNTIRTIRYHCISRETQLSSASPIYRCRKGFRPS